MTVERANKVYDILVNIGGAYELERHSFVTSHTNKDLQVDEWRFCGVLGFGGKYWCEKNVVSCYPEDMSKKRTELINQINTELAKLTDSTSFLNKVREYDNGGCYDGM